MAMTTSMTRSRRTEGLHQSHPNTRHPHLAVANAKAQNKQNFVAANLHRTKRQLDDSARDFEHVSPKRPRFTTGITVDIPARPSSFHSRAVRETTDAKHHTPKQQAAPTKPAAVVTGPNPSANPPHTPPAASPATAVPNGTTHQQHSGLTKHKEKVVNGLKHELNRLQPSAAVDTKDQGRKLRSQEATRFKSELSAYFPDYDEVIGNEPKEQRENTHTPLVAVFSPVDINC